VKEKLKKTKIFSSLLPYFTLTLNICAVFLLVNLLIKQILILILTIAIQLIDVNFYILFAGLGHVWLANPFFCNLWTFIATGFFNLLAMLLAWAAIERHILIFHSILLNTQKNKIIFHYCPLILIIIYSIIFRLK